jgi:hypothetical protein
MTKQELIKRIEQVENGTESTTIKVLDTIHDLKSSGEIVKSKVYHSKNRGPASVEITLEKGAEVGVIVYFDTEKGAPGGVPSYYTIGINIP